MNTKDLLKFYIKNNFAKELEAKNFATIYMAFKDNANSYAYYIITNSLLELGYQAQDILDDIGKTGAIPFESFSDCKSLTSITIPDSIKKIGGYEFYNCSSLISITIPDSVKRIGFHAFARCSSLLSIIIPDGVTSIEDGAFWGCSSLTSISIPSSVKRIEHDAFRDCSSLTSITIPDSVTSIEHNVFRGCSSLKHIEYDSKVFHNLNDFMEYFANKNKED